MLYITDDHALNAEDLQTGSLVVTNSRAYGPVQIYLPQCTMSASVKVCQSGKHDVYVVCSKQHSLARFGRLYTSVKLPGKGSESTLDFDPDVGLWRISDSSFPVTVTNIAEAVIYPSSGQAV